MYNHTSSKILGKKSPFQELFNKSPNIRDLKVFDSLAYPNLCPIQRKKFAPTVRASYFSRLFRRKSWFLLMDPLTKKLLISNDVVFFENIFEINNNYRRIAVKIIHLQQRLHQFR